MGFAKRFMEEVEDQGWYPAEDKWVCVQCVDEPFLASKVKEASDPEATCSFCDESSAAELDILTDAFVRGVKVRYQDANGELFYDAEEGRYAGRTYDTWDLVTWEYGHIFAGNGLLEAVRDSVVDMTWSDSHYWHYSPDEEFSAGWRNFCEAVKHETRYVFWLRKDWREQEHGPDGLPPAEILGVLGGFIDTHNLYNTIEVRDKLWRARTHCEDASSWNAEDLGTAGRDHSKQANRMSPAGMPMFYGAYDKDTAVRECLVRTADPYVTVGAFQATHAIRVIDLTKDKLPGIPSEFDVERANERFGVLFLHDFVRELNKPVRDSYEQIDYVPTQILTEYLLKVHHQDRDGFEGLMYTSAVTGKACVVIDVPNGRCIDRDDQIERYCSDSLYLKFSPDCKETFKIKRTYEQLPPEDPFSKPEL
ncbi:HEPN-associated N-terminal domain-containing protein [Streptomyces sp. NPDC056821]|uniref:HEPN-associated N-terminal domain-containing protein n=1 Tax=unclassified Streptomyces TaxID=2593676 RepID=UPI0036BF9B08